MTTTTAIPFSETPTGKKLAEVHDALKSAPRVNSGGTKEIRVFFQIHNTPDGSSIDFTVIPLFLRQRLWSWLSWPSEKEQEIGMLALKTLLQDSIQQAGETQPPTPQEQEMFFETASYYSTLLHQRLSIRSDEKTYFEDHCLENTLTTIPVIRDFLEKRNERAFDREPERMYAHYVFSIFQKVKEEISSTQDEERKKILLESLWNFLLQAPTKGFPPENFNIDFALAELDQTTAQDDTPARQKYLEINASWRQINTSIPEGRIEDLLDAEKVAEKVRADRARLQAEILEVKQSYARHIMGFMQLQADRCDEREYLRHLARQFIVSLPTELRNEPLARDVLQSWFTTIRSMFSKLIVAPPETGSLKPTIEFLQKSIPPDWIDEQRELTQAMTKFRKLENPSPMKQRVVDADILASYVTRKRQKIWQKLDIKTQKFNKWKTERDARIDITADRIVQNISRMQVSLSEMVPIKQIFDDTQTTDLDRLLSELPSLSHAVSQTRSAKDDTGTEALLEVKEKLVKAHEETLQKLKEHKTLFQKVTIACENRIRALKKKMDERHLLQKELAEEWITKVMELKAHLSEEKHPSSIERDLDRYSEEKFGDEYRLRELSLHKQSQQFIELTASFSGLQHELATLLPVVTELRINHPVTLVTGIEEALREIQNKRPKTIADLVSLQVNVDAFREKLAKLQSEMETLSQMLSIAKKSVFFSTKAHLQDRTDLAKNTYTLSLVVEKATAEISSLFEKTTETSDIERGNEVLRLLEIFHSALLQGTEAEQQLAGWMLYLFSQTSSTTKDSDYFTLVSSFLSQAIDPLYRAKEDRRQLHHEFRELQSLWEGITPVVGIQPGSQEVTASLKKDLQQLHYPDEQFKKAKDADWEPLMARAEEIEKKFLSFREQVSSSLKTAKESFSKYSDETIQKARLLIEELKTKGTLGDEQHHLCLACAAHRPSKLDLRVHTTWLVFWNSICSYATASSPSTTPNSLRLRFDQLKNRSDYEVLKKDQRYKAVETKLKELENPKEEEVQLPPPFDITLKIVQTGRLQVGEWLKQLEAVK